MNFKSIDEGENEDLVREFSKEEERKELCECDNSKSPRSDRVNFVLVKVFWDDIKADIMKVMSEFHLND
jgi:hypothetical protein